MQAPSKTTYDVVIVGGAMYGSSIAWWLTEQADFDGSVLVVERDPTYEFCSTSHTNSCIRQQFSAPINIQISQFGVEFIKNFRSFMGGDERVPDITLQSFGYLYLADNEGFAATLKDAQQVQSKLGSGTMHLTRDEIQERYPFYNLEDILAGNHNLVDEGYFDGNTIFDWWKRSARERGVEYAHNEVVSMTQAPSGVVTSVTLATGEEIACGTVVNCSGPRAVETSRMAGIDVPIEPRKRYTFIFQSEDPLGHVLPLTINPSGVHMRSDGPYFMAGCPPEDDHAVAYDDFEMDHAIWEDHIWPAVAYRVPHFERAKVINSWAGHYAYNTLDQNAIVGPHPEVTNFIFANGFSGHGFQQSPAIGRGVAEWIATGAYQSIDMSPFGYDRVIENRKFVEKAVI